MAQKGKFKLVKLNFNHIWKNNFVTSSDNLYIKNYFKFNILKKYIDFFFLHPFSKKYSIYKKIKFQKIYISQIWIHSYNNFLILTFSIKYRTKKIYYKNLIDNYIRLKYLNSTVNRIKFF